MSQVNGEPVEISTRMQPGEWTEESLAELTGSYQQKLGEMGAPAAEIVTKVDHADDGSVRVHVSWQHHGSHTYASLNQSVPGEATTARGNGEAIPPGGTSDDSQGLGAVLGDAERSAIDDPPTARAEASGQEQNDPKLLIYTDAEGETYVEEQDSRPRD